MKILVADDSGFVRNIIIKSLKMTFVDADIIAAADGREALTLYKAEKPDFIVSDLLMPEMTGQEFLTAVKAEQADFKAVVISADIQTATQEELREIGVIDFINKPVSPDKLAHLASLIREACHVE